MKKTVKTEETKNDDALEVNASFVQVVDAFAADRQVSRGNGKGFGSGALKVDGKIFAMMSSKGQFVVKLPRERVQELLASGGGEYFEPRPGRLMKEWVAVPAGKTPWVALAREAHRFVKGPEGITGRRRPG